MAAPAWLSSLVLALSLALARSAALNPPYHAWGVDYDWLLPAGASLEDAWHIDVFMDVTLDPGPSTYYYWSHYIDLTTSTAYGGIQTNGNHKTFIFSVWNSTSGIPDTSAAGSRKDPLTGYTVSYCSPFGGEGTGWHCLYDYNWTANTNYRFRISLEGRNSSGDSLRGTMLDPVTNEEVLIGTLFIPEFVGRPQTSVVFYEYYSSVDNCSAGGIPAAAMTFSDLSLSFNVSTQNSVAASWDSVSPYAYLNDAGNDNSCIGWASLHICNGTVSGASPLVPPLTKAPGNSCGSGPAPPPAKTSKSPPVPRAPHPAKSPPPAKAPPPVKGAAVTRPSGSCYSAGISVSVKWSNPGAVSTSDWIAMYPTSSCGAVGSTCNSGSTSWEYLCGSQTVCSTAETSPGSVSITIPTGLSTGVQYAFYYLLDNGYNIAALSTTFTTC